MDTVIKIGEDAPRFELPDLAGENHSLMDFRGLITVLNFWSAECDWCKQVDDELAEFAETWQERVKVLWIASNAHEPRALIEKQAEERKIGLVLVDSNQQVADLFGAQTTPHFFIIDGSGKLVYQGAWDNRSFRQRVATEKFVPQLVNALLTDQPLPFTQTQAYGCVLDRFAS